MRELTNDEMVKCCQAAESALPADAKDTIVMILMAADTGTEKGFWQNRISNCSKSVADELMGKWTKAQELLKNFGKQNPN